jgi:single-stranded DNA-binding protein
MDSWEKDGQKRTKLKVRAMTVKFLSGQPGQQPSAPAQPASVQSPVQPAAPAAPVDPVASDPDDIPF